VQTQWRSAVVDGATKDNGTAAMAIPERTTT